MAGYIKRPKGTTTASKRGTEESPFVKWLLITIALIFSMVFLFLPLFNVFAQAFSKGVTYYWKALAHPDSWAAMKLTLLVPGITVPCNVLFGIAAAWAIATFDFRGKSLLNSL